MGSAAVRWAGSALVGIAVTLGGCPKGSDGEPVTDDLIERRTVRLGPLEVASVEEQFFAGERRVRRDSHLTQAPKERSVIEAHLDERGFVRLASYARTGELGGRELTLESSLLAGGLRLRSGGRRHELPSRPVVLLEVLCRVQVADETDVEVVDLASGEHTSALVRRATDGSVELRDQWNGVIARCDAGGRRRLGPGAFSEAPVEETAVVAERWSPVSPAVNGDLREGTRIFLGGLGVPVGALGVRGPGQFVELEGVDPRTPFPALRRPVVLRREQPDSDAPQPRHRRAGLFIESDDERVRAFAEPSRRGTPAADALALAEAVGRALDTSGGGGPPSALNALERRAGDCDDATALLVASLRALGHPARPVVGYRAATSGPQAGRWVPHAWGEVFDGERWLPVDGMVPGLGPFFTHLRLFEGLGSPLTLGRVLSALEIVVEAPSAAGPKAGPAAK